MGKQVILLDEDRDDWALVQDSLIELQIDVSLRYISNSQELFEHLEHQPKPALILADYNAVPDNGLQVIKKLKSHPTWSDIPVFILSETHNDAIRSECYKHGASGFIKKPDTHEGTLKKINTFFRYWFDVVEA